jgi:hypothetical protein
MWLRGVPETLLLSSPAASTAFLWFVRGPVAVISFHSSPDIFVHLSDHETRKALGEVGEM